MAADRGSPPDPALRGAAGKAGRALLAIHHDYEDHLEAAQRRGAGLSGFRSADRLARISGGHVTIDAVAKGDPGVLATELRRLGLEGGAVFGRVVSGLLPIAAIPALQSLGPLGFARPAYAVTRAGAATSQGDIATRADIARGLFRANGTGITVGVLSDSFDCLGGAAAGIASGDLPAAVTVLEERADCAGATDEMRALAEIVHDIAPGAAIAAHSAFNGEAGFAQGIVDLANAGSQVIVDDVIYLTEPMFQDGPVAQAVDRVKGLGVAYFSAAGNYGRGSYGSPFRGSGTTVDLGFGPEELHDFDPGPGVDVCQQITIPVGQPLIVDFQWDQPFFSVSGRGSQSDLNILLRDADCQIVLKNGVDANLGRDPIEIIDFTNPGPGTTFNVSISRFAGPPPDLQKYVFIPNVVTIDEFATTSESGTAWGHANAAGGLGVGAAFYQDTPAFGTPLPVIEPDSSAGGVAILFDTGGNRLPSPILRAQPAIIGPDGGNTTFFIPGVDPEQDGFPNFFGTSASAPHAAGVAALLRDFNPSLNADEVYNALRATAIDMDDPLTPGLDSGFDFGTGHGLIQADLALASVPLPPPIAALPNPRALIPCTGTRCNVPVGCNLAQTPGAQCRIRATLLARVPSGRSRLSDEALAKASRRMVRFAVGFANIPPGQTANVRLNLTRAGRRIVRASQTRRRLAGVMAIRNTAGDLLSRTRVRLRLQ
jgi:subtilisin family serine protease